MGISTGISLFAGAGGLDIAAERAGIRTVARVEWDRYAQAVLMSRCRDGQLHDAPLWGDITTFDGRPWRGLVDCVFGGFPCQDVSFAGKRLSGEKLVAGTRSGLWSEFARVIREVGPSSVLVENVPGLLTGGLGDVLRELAEMGYDARWEVLSASDVGAPHLRERVFVVAFLREAVADSSSHRLGTAGACGRDDGDAGQRGQPASLADGKKKIPTPTVGDSKSAGSRNAPGSAANPGLSLTDFVNGDEGKGRKIPTPRASDGANPAGMSTRRQESGKAPDSLHQFVHPKEAQDPENLPFGEELPTESAPSPHKAPLPTPSATSYGSSGNGTGNNKSSRGRPSLDTMAAKNLWPTPTVGDGTGGRTTSKGKEFPTSLNAAVRGLNPKYGTPTASSKKRSAKFQETTAPTPQELVPGGQLNPTWVEWLMGWPFEWTVLDAAATEWFQIKPSRSSKKSPPSSKSSKE